MSIKCYDINDGPNRHAWTAETAAMAIKVLHAFTKSGARAECCGKTFTPSYNSDRHGPQIHRWHGLIEHRQSAHAEDIDMEAIKAATVQLEPLEHGLSDEVERYLVSLRRYHDDPLIIADSIHMILELPEESYRRVDVQRELEYIWTLIPAVAPESIVDAFPGSKEEWAALANALVSLNQDLTAEKTTDA